MPIMPIMPIMVKKLISQPITTTMNLSLTNISTLLDLFQTNFSKFKSSFHRIVTRLISQSTITKARAIFPEYPNHVGLMLYYAYLSKHLGSFVNEISFGKYCIKFDSHWMLHCCGLMPESANLNKYQSILI